MYIFHLLGTHGAVDDLEDDCYIILMIRNSTRLFFITQTEENSQLQRQSFVRLAKTSAVSKPLGYP